MKFLPIFLCLLFVSCNQKQEHIILSKDSTIEYVDNINKENYTSRTEIDWEGEYAGRIMYDNNTENDYEIILFPDNTYELKVYDLQTESTEIEQGSFDWNIDESKIRLNNPQKTEFIINKNEIEFYINGKINKLKKK
ncbi:MAG: copper resistance protein NlpE N-terminal domain-containing protein [Flavobacteriaceae bacterium]|nr:copper resistance protein NlpE N-terminal domain-containing protein [Flavobacteriaceae bacterium]